MPAALRGGLRDLPRPRRASPTPRAARGRPRRRPHAARLGQDRPHRPAADGTLVLRDYKTGRAPGTRRLFRGGSSSRSRSTSWPPAHLPGPGGRRPSSITWTAGGRWPSTPPRSTARASASCCAGWWTRSRQGIFVQEHTACDWCDYTAACGPAPLLERRRQYKIGDARRAARAAPAGHRVSASARGPGGARAGAPRPRHEPRPGGGRRHRQDHPAHRPHRGPGPERPGAARGDRGRHLHRERGHHHEAAPARAPGACPRRRRGPREERRRAAAALDVLERAQVSTIHALCAAILAERPLECGVLPGFRTADEAEADLLFAAAWEEWLADRLARATTSSWRRSTRIPLEGEGRSASAARCGASRAPSSSSATSCRWWRTRRRTRGLAARSRRADARGAPRRGPRRRHAGRAPAASSPSRRSRAPRSRRRAPPLKMPAIAAALGQQARAGRAGGLEEARGHRGLEQAGARGLESRLARRSTADHGRPGRRWAAVPAPEGRARRPRLPGPPAQGPRRAAGPRACAATSASASGC